MLGDAVDTAAIFVDAVDIQHHDLTPGKQIAQRGLGAGIGGVIAELRGIDRAIANVEIGIAGEEPRII